MDIRGKWIGFRRLWVFENRLQLIADRLFFGRTRSLIHRLEGMEILMDYAVGEQNGTGACVAEMSYAPLVASFGIEPGRMLRVLDLGANGGGFPLMLKRMGFGFSKLVAVEMNRRTFGRLSFNLLRNLDGDLVLINGAIAASDGWVELPECDGGIADSIFVSGVSSGATRRVAQHALDRVVREQFGAEMIDVVKIDIEGSEFELLESPVVEVLRQARFIIMEIHEHARWSWERVHGKFAELGFGLSPVRISGEANVFAYVRR